MARTHFAQQKLAAGAGALALLGLGVQSAFGAGRAVHQSSVVVSGTIVDANQKPVPLLQVVLNLPPVDSNGRIGSRSLPIASTTTDASGHFAITAEVTPQLQKLASLNDGWLNFDLLAFNSALTLYRSVPRQIVKSGWVGPPDTNGSTDLSTLTFAPGQPGVGPTKRRSVAALGGGRRSTTCTDTNAVLLTATLLTAVLEVHTATGTAHANYGRTADSFISVIVMIGASPWSESAGDVHIGNSLAAAATLNVGGGFHRLLRSYFSYVKVQTTNSCAGVRYAIRATQWTKARFSAVTSKDLGNGCAAAPYASHVQAFPAGGSFPRNANPAHRWDGAVNLTTLGGPASLATAESGYSSKVSVTWQFPSGGKLCGDNASPGSSGRISAGA